MGTHLTRVLTKVKLAPANYLRVKPRVFNENGMIAPLASPIENLSRKTHSCLGTDIVSTRRFVETALLLILSQLRISAEIRCQYCLQNQSRVESAPANLPS